MGLRDSLANALTNTFERQLVRPQAGSTDAFRQYLSGMIGNGGPASIHARTVLDAFDRSVGGSTLMRAVPQGGGGRGVSALGGVVGVSTYGVKGRPQTTADRRSLLDLYVIALNNADIRTATTHLRNEIFRRGIEWEPAFEFRCGECGEDYSTKKARDMQFKCRKDGGHLRGPDRAEIAQFERFLEKANYFQQSLTSVLRETEDDINVVDDAFLYMRKRYSMTPDKLARAQDPEVDDDDIRPDMEVMQIFRLDPTLVEFDLDRRGIPGMAHHVCVFHRDAVHDVPLDERWDEQWRGRCPECGLRTYPVYYRYIEQAGAGAAASYMPMTLYLLSDEVVHWSRYTPSELYGYSPILAIYEKALTLIGMDRYLYDYFYERKVPQGVVTVVTDDVAGFNVTKDVVEARMQQDPHYIPWMAISSKSGQGRMEFVRFAYSLDELNYLPVRDEIRERIAGIYGVSHLWMQSMQGVGGLNSESVPGDSPVWVRDIETEFIDCIPIAMLMAGSNRKTTSFSGKQVLSQNGWTEIKAVWRQMSSKPMYTFRAGDGIVRATGNHSIIVNGEAVAANEVKQGDLLTRVDVQTSRETVLTEEESWLLGFFAAEGSLDKNRVSWNNTDFALLDRAKDSAERVYGRKVSLYDYSDKWTGSGSRADLKSRTIAKWYKENATASYQEAHYEWDKELKKSVRRSRSRCYKKVPVVVLNGSSKIKRAFLDGYLAGDGSVANNGTVSHDSVDYVLHAGLHFLHRSLGESTRTSFRPTASENHNNVYTTSTLVSGEQKRRLDRDVVQDIYIDDTWHDYVYDIETADGTFVVSEGIALHNSQQLVVMSRVVEGAQAGYHADVFPAIERALGVQDWHLKLPTPEETDELKQLQIEQQRAQNAQIMASMGFGVEFDPDAFLFTFSGKVPSLEEQQKQQMQAAALDPTGGSGMAGGPDRGALAPTPKPRTPPPPQAAG